jgi:acyl carrier protein
MGMSAPEISRDAVWAGVPAQQTETAVRAVVARQLRVSPEELTVDLELTRDLGLDDAAALSVLTAVEEALDVRFPDDFLDGVVTYGDLTSAVRISLGP